MATLLLIQLVSKFSIYLNIITYYNNTIIHTVNDSLTTSPGLFSVIADNSNLEIIKSLISECFIRNSQ